MKHILSALLFFISATALAQNVKLTGVIKDSLAPLEMANIMAVNKGTNAMEAYAITDDAGRYQLTLKANTVYVLKASYIGYSAYEEEFTMPASATVKNIVLKEGIELDAVEIVSEMPVTIKGDTIVYNSDSFTNGTERKLEDVLKKLPGVEVDSDGNVKVEGKSVTKLMVEGKDFFDGDTKLGVKNIPADALDKVEVLRNYNEVSQLKGLENNQENVAMNIKLKEGKKNFWFGDISASASIGEGERYLVNPKLFYYSPKYSINVIGNINNTGELPLSMQDYFNMTGGFRNIMSKGGTSFNVGSNDLGMLTLRNNRAKSIETKFGAANFSYNPSKAWTISGFGIFNSNQNEMETHTRNQVLNAETNEPETTQTVDDHTIQRTDFSLLKLSSSYIPNAKLHLDYDAFLKGSRQTENTDLTSAVYPETTQSQDIYTNKKQNPFSFNQNLNFYYTMDEKNVFAFEAQQLYQEEDPFYTANLQYNPFPDTDGSGLNLGLAPAQRYDINQKRFVKTNKFDAKADYYYMVTPKANINLTVGATHSYQNFDSYLFQVLDDGSTDALDDNTKNDVSYSFTDVFAALHYKFITGKFTFNPGLAAHSYSSYNEQLGTKVTQDFARVLPDVFAVYQIKKSERLQYTYNMTTEFTDVAKFAQGLVLNNYSSLFRGNRNLENALYQNHNLNYFKYNMFNFTQIYGGITYSYRMDAIKNLSAFSGINQVGTVENSGFADQALTANAGYNRSFARYYKASVTANIGWNKYNNFRFDNNSSGEEVSIDDALRQVNEQFTQTYTASFGTNYKTWPNLELGYSVNINDYANNKFYTHSPFARMDYLLTQNITLTADYTYNHYYNDSHTSDNEYDFLNAYVMYAIPNSKWEFKVGGTNLLNTGSLNDDSFSQFSTRTSRYSIQPRYLLFNVRYSI
jgi:Outer membrane protein beta-barrel family/CarboxypepD_reg-like domain